MARLSPHRVNHAPDELNNSQWGFRPDSFRPSPTCTYQTPPCVAEEGRVSVREGSCPPLRFKSRPRK